VGLKLVDALERAAVVLGFRRTLVGLKPASGAPSSWTAPVSDGPLWG